MTRRLESVSDEAHDLARAVAEETGRPVKRVVAEALRGRGAKLPPRGGMSPTQIAEAEALKALGCEAAKHKLPGATSNHGDLYDEFGLPK